MRDMDAATPSGKDQTAIRQWLKRVLSPKLIDGRALKKAFKSNSSAGHSAAVAMSEATHEKILISNVLKLRDLQATDVMIPRADIFAVDLAMPQDELLALLLEKPFSRVPVYNGTLDHVVGWFHIKDILPMLAAGHAIDLKAMLRPVSIISPAMPARDLLLMMQQTKRHLVMVVDEYGGIDGLVTIGDVMEAIVGDIDDEDDPSDEPHIVRNADGTIIADARFDADEFEKTFMAFMSEDERNDVDTLGGLVATLAGRVPARGEMIAHPSGIVFEILDSSPRHVNRLRIRNVPLVHTAV